LSLILYLKASMKLHDLFGSTITACGCAAVAARAAAVAVLLSAAHLAQAQTVAGPNKFIPTFLVYYGGGPTLVASDAAKLAKFDLLDIDRFRYNEIGPNTWAAVKAVNPNIQIYLYEDGPEAQNYMDALPQISINGMGRHNVSRGHSMGSLNGNHPELFLLDSSGNRIYNAGFSNVAANQFWYLMDFGSPTYQAYWVEGVKADIIDQPWVADGVHADLCVTFGAPAGENAVPVKYPTDAVWSVAMNNFARAITAGLHTHGQKLWCNKGSTTSTAGVASWVALDSGANPPDVMAEEGAFAVAFGPWSTQFVPEALWKNQVDVMSAVTNTKVAMFSHTALGEGQSGTDNWGLPVSYWQTLWYSLGSFLLGKNDTLNNAYFFFSGNGEALNRIWWYDEYDKIDLGKALGPYAVTTIGGVNIYSREFERGYVLVNPTPSNVASITIPQASRQLTHGNLLSPLDSIPTVTAIPLSAHNATILVKAVVVPPLPDTAAPSTPTGLAASATSSSQINLSWTASTDNVGVTGYRVSRGGALLATLGAVTSFQNTGLAASTTYSYTVQAIDAAGNASGQSAAASAATLAGPDTMPPSAPTGLTGRALTPAQIQLTWNASTDNIGVTGYTVYLNDVALATIATTSFRQSGLTPGTTYTYRVSATDAAQNNSAWTAPVTVRTPGRRIAGSDFNGDGKSDILLRNIATGDDAIWLMNGAVTSSSATFATVADPSWGIAGAGDFDGDGKADILWRNSATGANTIWFMNGAAIATSSLFATVADPNWSVAGVGDFNGDGKADVLWRNSATGANTIWLMNGASIATSDQFATVADPDWTIAGVGDFNGDGKADILWRHLTTGANTIWLMNGTSILSDPAVDGMTDFNWSIAGIGDFDGDGKSDILWHNQATGANSIWLMNGAVISGGAVAFETVADLNWNIVGVGDLDGDGKSDIVWRNGATGETLAWLMSGAAVLSRSPLTTVPDLNWRVASGH